MDRLVRQIQDWWNSTDKTTKIVSVVGGLLLVALVVLTMTLSSSQKMSPVAGGMSELERSGAYDELVKKGYKVELTPQGDLLVPDKDAVRARMDLAKVDKLPKTGGSGFGLDKIGVFDTPSVESEKLLKSRESDLAASINTIEGVAASNVHIALGKDAAVMDEKVAPTAVVALTETSPGSVSKEAGKAISNLVVGAISGIKVTGVTVITNSGRTLFDGKEQDSDSGISSQKLETERLQSKVMTQQLQQELDTAFGRGTTIAKVVVSYNMNPKVTENHRVTPTAKPVSVETGEEKLLGTGTAAVGGVAGAAANNPGNPATPVTSTDGDGHKYSEQVKHQTFEVSTENVREVSTPVLSGELITVLADKGKIKNVKDLTSYVKGQLGDLEGSPGYSATIVPTEFSTADATVAKKAADDASGAQRMQQMMGLLPVIALLGVGYLVSRSLPKVVATTAKPLEANATPALNNMMGGFNPGAFQMPEQQVIHDYSALAGYQPQFGEPTIIEHRFSGDPTGARTASAGSTATAERPESVESAEERERRQTEEVMRALGIDDAGDEVDFEAIKQKVNVPLERIKRMADRKPELMANLIRGWMMEDHA